MLNKLSREVLTDLVYQFLTNPNIEFPAQVSELANITLSKENNKFKDASRLDIKTLEKLTENLNLSLVSSLESKLKKHLQGEKNTPNLIKSVIIAYFLEKEGLKIENSKTLLNKYIKYCNKYCFLEEVSLVHAILSKFS